MASFAFDGQPGIRGAKGMVGLFVVAGDINRAARYLTTETKYLTAYNWAC